MSIGDSVVLVADDEIVKVHVHTNHPGQAFEKALTYGALSRMKIDNMREEHQEKLIKDAQKLAREQEEQEKKDAAMRNSLEIGDQVTTIGGVIGRVVAIKDDTFVLETGADRVKIRFTKTAIGSVEKLNMDKAESKTDKK